MPPVSFIPLEPFCLSVIQSSGEVPVSSSSEGFKSTKHLFQSPDQDTVLLIGAHGNP